MDEIGFPELTMEQVSELCETAEQAARDYVLSKVPTSRIVALDVTVDAEGTKPVTVNVEANIVLSPLMKDFDVKDLTKQATKRAFERVEQYLRELKCNSTK
ncbi:MAG: DUF3194 domain-containing protein [Candidatus Bathyarchaeia archaeon]